MIRCERWRLYGAQHVAAGCPAYLSQAAGLKSPKPAWPTQVCAGSRYAPWDVRVALTPSISAQLTLCGPHGP